ncbi:MAG: hypothetical protein QNJ97_28425 [Myxococcota bacterium]|nr:hypothetical protein [Myxococcota bacterium]
MQTLLAGMPEMLKAASPATLCAEVIWTAVTDGTATLRYTAGDDAKAFMANRTPSPPQTHPLDPARGNNTHHFWQQEQ